MTLEIYMKEHRAIEEEIKAIRTFNFTNEADVLHNAHTLAQHVNTLSGKLKMHLLTEDKYLYPSLNQNKDAVIRTMSSTYQSEMGDLQSVFLQYKEQFNTKSKINENPSGFLAQTKLILSKIESRVMEEETELYKLL